MPQYMLIERLQATKFTSLENSLTEQECSTKKLVTWCGQFKLSPTICS